MTDEQIITLQVPSGHPMEGSTFTLYPSNGATTYTEGVVHIESPRTQQVRALREALADTRAALADLRST